MSRRALTALAAAALAAAGIVAATCGGGPAGPNILLVTVETFRRDHLGATRDGVALTPNLDRLAARGARFDRAYAASSFTLPSLHTIATGEPPPVHRVRFWTQFGNRFRGATLAQLMKDEGYRTGFVYSAYHLLGAYPILGRGWTEPPAGFREEDAAPVLAAASAWLDRHGREPFFLWVHLFEPHTPYGPDDRFASGLADLDAYHAAGRATYPVQEWADKVPGGRGPQLADALHAADVRAADDAVARLLADLDARGLTPKTVVCVVADHGENLSGDPAPRWDHGVSTDEQLIRVPLVFAGPGVARGVVDAGVARHVDLPATILRFAGAQVPESWRGRDLFGGSPAPRFAVAECTTSDRRDAPFYSVTDGERSLRLFTAPAPWRVELRDERDRGAPPLSVDMREPLPAALPLVDAWKDEAAYCERRAPELNEPGPDDAELTQEQKDILKIGYAGGGRK